MLVTHGVLGETQSRSEGCFWESRVVSGPCGQSSQWCHTHSDKVSTSSHLTGGCNGFFPSVQNVLSQVDRLQTYKHKLLDSRFFLYWFHLILAWVTVEFFGEKNPLINSQRNSFVLLDGSIREIIIIILSSLLFLFWSGSWNSLPVIRWELTKFPLA